jgi:hypothetical protein
VAVLDRRDGERVERRRDQSADPRARAPEALENEQRQEEDEHDRRGVDERREAAADEMQVPVLVVSDRRADGHRGKQRQRPVDVPAPLLRVVRRERRVLDVEVPGDRVGPGDGVGDDAEIALIGMEMAAVVPVGPVEAQPATDEHDGDEPGHERMPPRERRRLSCSKQQSPPPPTRRARGETGRDNRLGHDRSLGRSTGTLDWAARRPILRPGRRP